MTPRVLSLLILLGGILVSAAEAQSLRVWPDAISLNADHSRQQLLVTVESEVPPSDATRSAVYQSSQPSVVTIDTDGVIRAVGPGNALVTIQHNGQSVTRNVIVGDLTARPIDFERDVQPFLTHAGCNAGPCHGKARGQNGFQLSLLGFDSDFDFDSLTKEARGRRLDPSHPQASLLLRKPAGQVPHGGGIRLARDRAGYQLILQWIADGTPRRQPQTPSLTQVSVEPTSRSMVGGATQQLAVTAHYADGSTRDVTHLASFQSNEAGVAAVDPRGGATATGVMGEAAITARYLGKFAIHRVAVPMTGAFDPAVIATFPRRNFIDDHVATGWERLRLSPSAAATDEKFLRRAYVDIIGQLPTTDEAREFLDDTTANKRDLLVEKLLARPEYAEHWANKWADLLRTNPYRVGIKATLNYDYWIRDSFRKNKPYDQFVRELITAQGSTYRQGQTTLFRDRREPEELTTIVSQLFLGIRLECAKCHQHPFESYSQKDFYSFAAYFSKLGRKGTGLSPPISGSEEFLFTAEKGQITHPVTGEVLPPRPLFGTAPDVAEGSDPRESLAVWMTSPENPYFAQTMANRVWADLMGRGLVEPVDDLRATNPATNPALLEALGKDFASSGFNIKHLIRRIATSSTYALSSLPTERNIADTRNFSRHYRQRLRAEVLLDSVAQICHQPSSFEAMPPGSLSKEIWTHRIDSLSLDTFGRPDPNQDPPCERTTDTTVVQALHLMNSNQLANQIMSDNSLPHLMASSERTPDQIIEEMYLACYSRRPNAEEMQIGVALFDKVANRRGSGEDLLWALLNTPEFVFKD
ncbi:MAG: DUF1553 domain-containing protein [Planctomycetota bacterium]|nr:MAG: DUF1553 domain-containing protein [Planctomycetota bacterium]